MTVPPAPASKTAAPERASFPEGYPEPRRVDVPVDGGSLATWVWDGAPGAPVVIAVHGITASHVAWAPTARALAGDVTLVAPDLRGRGCSDSLPASEGLVSHGRDLVAVLDHLGIERATLVGHSMGAYVAVLFASRHAERCERIALVDGGLPMPPPPGMTPDEIAMAVLGPSLARLSMTFESRQAYHDFWKQHPALGPYWTPMVETYVDYDLAGEAPEMRSRVSAESVKADSLSTLVDDSVERDLRAITCPAVTLRAPRGMFDQVPPLHPDELAAKWADEIPTLTDLGVVDDVNHFTIGLGDRGAEALAGLVRSQAATTAT